MTNMSKDALPEWAGSARNPDLATAIGAMEINWAYAERTVEFLIWEILKVDRHRGESITTHIGNVTRCEILIKLFQEIAEPAKIVGLHAMKCFDVLRENRNEILHGMISSGLSGSDDFVLFRISAKGQVRRFRTDLRISDVRHMSLAIWSLRQHLLRLRMHIRYSSQHPLPEKFPKPDKLTLRRLPIDLAGQPLPRS
jgi:hypothetical protein